MSMRSDLVAALAAQCLGVDSEVDRLSRALDAALALQREAVDGWKAARDQLASARKALHRVQGHALQLDIEAQRLRDELGRLAEENAELKRRLRQHERGDCEDGGRIRIHQGG